MSNLIFVYGTLKKGYWNHYLLENNHTNFVRKAKTKNKYSLTLRGAIPCLFKNPETSQIQGELYEVSNYVMSRLDRLEGHPFVYCREQIEIEGYKEKAWCYFYHPINIREYNHDIIKSGKYEFKFKHDVLNINRSLSRVNRQVQTYRRFAE